jgi:DNA-binding transcriptional LysR family regulator
MLFNNVRLQHLLSIAEHAHFGRAAAALNISQPALSKSIKSLETDLGFQLLERSRKGTALTVFGELVVRHGALLIQAQSELLRELHLLSDLEIGSLRVALGPYPSVISGYEAAGKVLALHPHLKVSLRVGGWKEVARLVLDREADIGVAELSLVSDDRRFVTELVGQHQGRFLCRPGHPLLGKGAVPMSALFDYPWINTRLPKRNTADFPREPTAAGSFDPRTGEFVPSTEFDAPIQLSKLISNTDAVTFSSLGLVEAELKAGLLVPIPGLGMVGNYGFIYLQNRPLSPATRTYMKAIRCVEKAYCLREQRLEKKYQALLQVPDGNQQ